MVISHYDYDSMALVSPVKCITVAKLVFVLRYLLPQIFLLAL